MVNLKEWIEIGRDKGISDDDMRETLLQKGYSAEEINEGMGVAGGMPYLPPKGEEGDGGYKVMKTVLIIAGVLFGLFFFLGSFGRNIFGGLIFGLPFLLIIFGLPIFGITMIIVGSVKKGTGKPAAGFFTSGLVSLLLYGACWGLLIVGLSGF